MIRFIQKWRLRRAIRNFSSKFVRGEYPCVCGHWRVLHAPKDGRCRIGYFYDNAEHPCWCLRYVPAQELADDFGRVIQLARAAKSL